MLSEGGPQSGAPELGPDIEKEKQKNVKIAIGIAAAGITGGIFIYVVLFALMFLFPFAVFSFLPDMEFPRDMVSLEGKKLLVFTESVNPPRSWEEKPVERTTMEAFEKGSFTEPVQVKPFDSVTEWKGRAYFLNKGGYRIYDGRTWTEHRSAAVGDSAKGAAGPPGLWVLSKHDGTPALTLITGSGSKEASLPEGIGGASFCRMRLIWGQDALHLFSRRGQVLTHWRRSETGAWRAMGSFDVVGRSNVFRFGDWLVLLTKAPDGAIAMRSFDGEVWSEPRDVGVGGPFTMQFLAAQYGGDIALLTMEPFSVELHVLGKGGAVKRERLSTSFGTAMMGKVLAANGVFCAAMVLFVLGVSAVVNRYKLRRWPVGEGRTVEFASLFRRFVAHTLDMLITLLPLSALISIFIVRGFPKTDPMRLMGIMLLGGLAYFLGILLYFSLFEGLLGKTPGKWLTRIEVRKEDGSPCTLGPGFLRNVLRIVDAMFYYMVGAVAIGATLKWQRLGDLASGTVVVMKRGHKGQ
jgi:uncharacterized RDD family membrane protein YckC